MICLPRTLAVRVNVAVLFYTIALSAVRAEIPAPPGKVDGDFDIPVLEGEPWQLVGKPDLGEYNSPKQEPVDFAVWQAADGTWQLWSCIRHTKTGGEHRLFHGWEGTRIEQPNWKPTGIQMQADVSLGETEGGLQAPHVVFHDGKFHMLYGDWNRICRAESIDGKKFTKVVQPDGKTGMYADGDFTRDAMALKIKDLWYVYTTSDPNGQCAIRCRTSPDLQNWGRYSITVASGGRASAKRRTAECPQVVKHKDLYYLFRTESYRGTPMTHVYVSSDPLHFGNNRDEWYYATTLNLAAPEYVLHEGNEYLAYLNTGLDGVRMQKLAWKSATR
jgi:hypothetical protein